MTGNFWDYPLPYDSGCVINSPCRMSFFDQFNSFEYDLASSDMVSLRSGRAGLGLIFFGVYLILRISGVLIPEQEAQKNETTTLQKENFTNVVLISEGYDGNIWE